MAPQGTLPPELMPKPTAPSGPPAGPSLSVGQVLPPLMPGAPVAPTSTTFGTQAGK
jgi:hypothetical protein